MKLAIYCLRSCRLNQKIQKHLLAISEDAEGGVPIQNKRMKWQKYMIRKLIEKERKMRLSLMWRQPLIVIYESII